MNRSYLINRLCHSGRSEESSYFEQFEQLQNMLISSGSRSNQPPRLVEVAGCFAALNMTGCFVFMRWIVTFTETTELDVTSLPCVPNYNRSKGCLP